MAIRRCVRFFPGRKVAPAVVAVALSWAAGWAAQPTLVRGALVEGVACRSDPTQTYTLFLPKAYTVERKWPVLLIFDPRGRSVQAAEIFRDAAERHGWILMSSNDTRSDGPSWEVNHKAVTAMLPELVRFACDPARTYATGFSGGAMLAWALGQETGGLAGVIASGGRPFDDLRVERVPFAFFGAAGDGEFNYQPTRELDALAEKHGAPHRFESFPGPHRWMPAELALEAVEWMELQAMRSGTRPRDSALVETLYDKDVARARALEGEGRILAAGRRYDAIARTFAGLRPVEGALAKSAEMAALPGWKEALATEKNAERYRIARMREIGRAIARFRSPEGEVGAGRLAAHLRVGPLMDTAKEDTPLGLAARQALNSLNAELSFYLPREFFAAGDHPRAAAVLEVAIRIDDGNPRVWYNLASALAQGGNRKRAVEALVRAVEAGFDDADQLAQDADLEPLRELPDFQALVEALRQAGA